MIRNWFEPRGRSFRAAVLLPGAVILLAALVAPAAGNSGSISQLRRALERAVCLNQWEQAAAVASLMIASTEISAASRESLIAFRRQLGELQATSIALTNSASCQQFYAETLAVPAETPEEPPTIGWASAIASLTMRAPVVELDNRADAVVNPPIPSTLLATAAAPLAAATPIDTRDGFAVVAGQVGEAHQGYSFLAGRGDRVTLDLDVTRIFPGTRLTSDDSQLFMFDRSGRLMAQNDDADGRQSLIADLVIPETAVYFAVVTTHQNEPIFDADQRLIGWSDDGGARFDYTLTLTGLTPAAALLR
ncbi:MAG: hypothetical protein F6J97_21580 [Leptolyngbya sp. SIO4C1]|nr:hypothetical protein [Leptolyngbya sp. SIO4C1]